MERALGLSDDLLRCSSEYNGASFAEWNSGEFEQSFVSDLNLFDDVTVADFDHLGVVEG